MSQLTYNRTMDAAFAGMKADATNDTVDTGVSEESSAEIPFGVALAQGSGQDGVKLPAASTDLIVGVSIHTHTGLQGSYTATSGPGPKDPVNVGAKCRVWVKVEDAVTPSSKVFVRHAANGGNTQKGSFRGTTDTGATQQLFGARFRTSAAGGGLAVLEVDFTTVKSFGDFATAKSL